jgi:hypothetical protein
MTITEFGPGKWFILSRRPSMKAVKVSALKEPSRILTYNMPSSEIAGRTEYLTVRVISYPSRN